MSSSSVVSPFNCLLNSISDNLSPQNLQSLIHICERYIPESKREEIKNGLDVFRILKHQNVIADDREKIHHLEQIVKAMRPKRKDIIKRVRDFIRTNYDPYHEFQSSNESYCEPPAVLVVNHHQPPPLDRYNSSSGNLESISGSQNELIRSTNVENHCSMDCCCLGCKCYARRIPSCVLLILTAIMAILTFLSAVFWFDKIPDKLYSKMGSNASKAGGYVVGCFGMATMGLLSWWIYRKVQGNRHVSHIPYQGFTNPVNSPVGLGDQMNTSSTVAEKGSTQSQASVKLPAKKQKTRSFGSVTATSSLDTAASVSLLERGHHNPPLARRVHMNSTTDGGLQTDGACASGETDESLFGGEYSDYSSDEPTAPPPMTAE